MGKKCRAIFRRFYPKIFDFRSVLLNQGKFNFVEARMCIHSIKGVYFTYQST